MRYLAIYHGSVEFAAPTINELFERITAARRRGAQYGYRHEGYEIVDRFDEPGRIVYALQDPPRMPRWEPGESFADDDHTALRFKAMELV